jgi:hypothetical protein
MLHFFPASEIHRLGEKWHNKRVERLQSAESERTHLPVLPVSEFVQGDSRDCLDDTAENFLVHISQRCRTL